jgi:hypothetical protein
MSINKIVLYIFFLASTLNSLTYASKTIDPNEEVNKLFNYEVYARNVLSQVYLQPEFKDIPSDTGFTLGKLITNAYLYKDEDGTHIEPKVYIIGNNVRLRIDIISEKDEDQEAAKIVFDFSIEDFSVKDPTGTFEGNIAEGHGAMLTGGHIINTGETFDQLVAAKLIQMMMKSEFQNASISIAEATEKAKQLLTERNNIKIDYQKLDNGPYGIPLNSSYDNVISWCKEKQFIIKEPIQKIPVIESITFEENGKDIKAQDKGFTERLFKIDIEPSEELKKEEIRYITIYFQKTDSAEYNSYAVKFCYSRHKKPYVKLNAISKVLNDKYGEPEFLPIGSTDKGIGNDIHALTGMNFGLTEAAIWKRNIMLFGKFNYSKAQGLEPFDRYEPLYLLYFTPESGTSIPKAYENALEMCKNNHLHEQEASKKRMVDTF